MAVVIDKLVDLIRSGETPIESNDVLVHEDDPDEDLPPVGEEQDTSSDRSLRDLDPVTVLFILKDMIGDDWWSLETEAILDAVDGMFPRHEADDDIVYALRTLRSSEKFWTDFDILNYVTTGLAGDPVMFSSLPVLDLYDMIVALDTSDVILRLQGATAKLDKEVVSYIATTCMEHGLWALPDPLEVAQDRIDQLMWANGWSKLPLDKVVSLSRSGVKIEDETEVDHQAGLYSTLEKARASRSSGVKKQIAKYLEMRGTQ